MSRENKLSDALRLAAVECARRITRSAIRTLREMHAGDGILSTHLQLSHWDVICFDRAFHDAGLFEIYDLDVDRVLTQKVEALAKHERLALWLQTDEGWGWAFDDNGEREPVITLDPIIQHLKGDHLYPEADAHPSRKARAVAKGY